MSQQVNNFVEQVNIYSGQLSRHFMDFLREHQHFSDSLWLLLHDWNSTQFDDSLRRNPSQIAQDVFNDPVIESLLQNDPSINAQIKTILDEMAHSFSIKYARIIYFLIMKVMKSTYEHVYVENRLGSEHNLHDSLNALARNTRIVFLPNHRSYADYLGYSFLSFSNNIPIPTLATGRNLLSMNLLVSLLRCCGAFFIRRNFQSDQLYWKVFRAYVRSQVIGGEQPFAFYLEGTRSRSGKSYYPKIGTLKTIVEMVMRGQVDDVTLVPVMHCYDRVFEEEVYARELSSGYAKPNENIFNLILGIRQIVSQQNGSAYIRFCEPISVRQMLQSTAEYRQFEKDHAKDNLAHEMVLTEKENQFVIDLAKRVLLTQNANSIFSSFNLAAIIILFHYHQWQQSTCPTRDDHSNPSCPNLSFPFDELVNDLSSLALLIPHNVSTSVNRLTMQEDLIRALKVHSNLVHYDQHKEMVTVYLERPLVLMQLQMYANQAMQLLIDHSVCLFTYGNESNFRSIRLLLEREFIFLSNECHQMLNKAVQSLMDFEVTFGKYEDDKIMLTKTASTSLQMQVYFNLSMYKKIAIFLDTLCEAPDCVKTFKLKLCHKMAQDELQISSDLIQNTFAVMMERGCVIVDTHDNSKVEIIQCALHSFIDELTNAIDVNKNLLQCQ